jgi:Protein of unknown function (DUF3383)
MSQPVSGYFLIKDSTPSVQGFNTALILGEHAAFPDVREFSADAAGLTALVTAGISIDSNIYDLAKTLIMQSPHISAFKVGKISGTATETMTLTVGTVAIGERMYVSLGSGAGDIIEIQRSCVTAVSATEAASMAALISSQQANTGVACAAAGAVLTLTRAATKPVRLRGFSANMTFKDNTSNPTIAADLAAIQGQDPDWFGLLCTSRTATSIGACQAFAEANAKVYIGLCADTDCTVGASATDALAVGRASNLNNGPVIASRDRNGNADAALMGFMFQFNPGTATYANWTLAGPRVDTWSAAELAAIQAKKGIGYARFKGIAMTRDGWAPSGRYIDLTTLAYKVVARCEEGLAALLAREKKIGFTSKGRALVENEFRSVAQLEESEDTILPGWTVTVPSREQVTTIERAQRKMPRCKLSFAVTGAMHEIENFEVEIVV